VSVPVGFDVHEVPTPKRLIIEVSAPLDEDDLDRIARLQLMAHRIGLSIAIRDATGRVRDLIALCGLSEVLAVDESGVEVQRQPETGEERGVNEVVDRGDRPV
jgi:hypothetical protein